MINSPRGALAIVLGGQLSTAADVRARLPVDPAAWEIDWANDRILAAALDVLVQGGFAVKLAGDEPLFRILREPSPAEALRMNAELRRELAKSESASNET